MLQQEALLSHLQQEALLPILQQDQHLQQQGIPFQQRHQQQ